MLALTDSAVKAVKGIVGSAEAVPETGGLRIVADHSSPEMNFRLNVVALPDENDEVFEDHGARLFLEPEVASLLDDKILDANIEGTQVAFTVEDQMGK